MTEDSKISELKENQKNVYLKNVEVVETKGVENWTIKGKPIEVVNAVIEDEAGDKIKITAWEGNQKNNYAVFHKLLAGAKRIDVENCFCKRIGSGNFKGELQITLGDFGRVKVLEKNDEVLAREEAMDEENARAEARKKEELEVNSNE